ncbi:MAG: AAA family ATPase, partial [Bacteroidota bacterium]
MIKRTISDRIYSKIGRGKAIMIIGPRQVGKTTLILEYLKDLDYKF